MDKEFENALLLKRMREARAKQRAQSAIFVKLCEAIDDSDVERVRACVTNNPGIGTWTFTLIQGRTGLMRAALAGSVEVVKELLPVSDPNQRSAADMTALALAVLAGEDECARLLLPHTHLETACGHKKKTLLMLAATSGSACLGWVLGASNANAQDEDGQTALMHMARQGAEVGLEALVATSDWSLRDREGKTAIDHALKHNAWPLLDLLALQGTLEQCEQWLKKGQQKIQEFGLPPFRFARAVARLERAQLQETLQERLDVWAPSGNSPEETSDSDVPRVSRAHRL